MHKNAVFWVFRLWDRRITCNCFDGDGNLGYFGGRKESNREDKN